jgi:AP-1 complex subunit gamma-1
VSEKRKVGSTRVDKDSLVDLMGDEASTTGAPTPTALDHLGSAQNTQDLLADIFGSSDMSSSSPAPSQPKPQNAVNDIMSLFGNTSISPNPTGSSPAPAVSSSLDLLSSMASAPSPTPPVASPAAAAAPASQQPKQQLQSYTAYEKNGLKVTLTPKVNPAQQGMVQILARFTTTGAEGVRNVNFQAAVPKVSSTS